MPVFYVMFLLVAAGSIFLWKGSLLPGILLLLASVAGVALWVFFRKKEHPFAAAILLPVCLVLCLATIQAAPEGGIQDYDEQIKKAAVLMEKGKQDEAAAVLDELDEGFGVTDLTLYARAEQSLFLRDYDAALAYISRIEDTGTQNYYEYMERIYGLQNTPESEEKLKEMYFMAAADLPENGHMQYMAGLERLKEGAYRKAVYYLLRAKELDESDPMPCYYLGVVYFELDDLHQAAGHFADALERGVGGEEERFVKWYVSRILEEGGLTE